MLFYIHSIYESNEYEVHDTIQYTKMVTERKHTKRTKHLAGTIKYGVCKVLTCFLANISIYDIYT